MCHRIKRGSCSDTDHALEKRYEPTFAGSPWISLMNHNGMKPSEEFRFPFASQNFSLDLYSDSISNSRSIFTSNRPKYLIQYRWNHIYTSSSTQAEEYHSYLGQWRGTGCSNRCCTRCGTWCSTRCSTRRKTK